MKAKAAADRVQDPVRVVQIFGSLDRGGAESRMIQALLALPEGSVDTHFLLLSGREGDLADDAREANAKLYPLPVSWRLPFRYLRLLTQIRPRVVHSHVHFSSGAFLAVAAWTGVPIRIAHLHSTTDIRAGRGETWTRRTRRLVLGWMIRRYATEVIAVGQAVLDANPTIVSNRSTARVFYSAVATEGLEALLIDADESDPRVVQIGRLDPEKNQLLAVEVFSSALERGVKAELWMVGRSTEGYVGKIEQRVADLGLEESVRLCGLRSDVMTFVLPTSAVMLHTSTVEGLPGVVLEALATGTPVVASDIPPHREVAGHLDGITLVGLDQPVSAWADALVPLIAMPPTGSQRRERLRAFRSSEFALEQHIPRLLALWGVRETG